MPSPRRQRELASGGVTKTKKRKGATVCGAGTTTCLNCGCNRRLHKYLAPKKREPCSACGPEKCAGWKPKPCEAKTPHLMKNGRCRIHGGSSPSGLQHPSYKKGIYSEVVPKKIAQDYEQLLGDEELLSLRDEIAMTRVYIRENIRRSGSGDWIGRAAISASRAIEKAWVKVQSASSPETSQRAEVEMETALNRLKLATSAARTEAEARSEFRELTASLEKLERSENIRVVQLYNMISAERALALIHSGTQVFLKALLLHIPDDELPKISGRELRNLIRRSVASDLTELIRGRNAPALAAGGGSGGLDITGDIIDSETEE